MDESVTIPYSLPIVCLVAGLMGGFIVGVSIVFFWALPAIRFYPGRHPDELDRVAADIVNMVREADDLARMGPKWEHTALWAVGGQLRKLLGYIPNQHQLTAEADVRNARGLLS